MPTHTEEFEKLRGMLKEIDFCMLSTIGSDNNIHSRPMSLNSEIDEEGNLWFFTSSRSLKASEIEESPRVNASFANPDDQIFVSVSGTATLVTDRQKIKELWKPILKAWFPDGPEQEDLALLKITLEKAEYWEGPSSTISQVVSFVSAIVTGKQVELGENKKLSLS